MKPVPGYPLDATSHAPAADVDAATVVEIARALSAETVLPELVERTVAIGVEVSGATRGLLLLPRDGEPGIQARALASDHGVAVTIGSMEVGADLAFTRVLADDESAVRLPLPERRASIGLLHLEGSPGTFTPRRVALLEILAEQAAIALENARLHTDLQAAQDRVRDAERENRVTVDTIPVMCWRARPDGSVDFLNRTWLEYAGMTMEQAREWGWTIAIHPDDAARLTAIWTTILASGAAGELEARLRRHDGVYRWFLFRARAIRDNAGAIVRWYGTNTDIEDLKRAEGALRRSEDSLTEAQRMSHTGSFTWDPATGAVGWSEETFRIYELDLRSPPTLSTVVGRTHPDDQARLEAALDRAAREGLDWEDQRRLVMPDGRLKHVHVIAHAIRDEGSRVTFAGAVKDVTAARDEAQRLQAALQDKEALLKEVHHRVKNNLQLVCSLLDLEAARSNPDVARLFTQSSDRVRSMALVHENLYRAGDFGRVPMGRHIANLCENLARAYRSDDQRVSVIAASSDLHIDMDRAVACGLIINELVSNALKHAFPGGRPGRIAVGLAAAHGDRCLLTVHDDGVGLPPGLDVGRIDSLGLQLVHDLADQLHGTVSVSRDAGTTFTIAFDAHRPGRTS